MWDRLLVDCSIATMEATPGNPLGLIENGAIGIADGKIVRVGKRTELAGFRAKEVVALGGAWVTPGLIDCHTHLVFGGTRADEHAMRRAGATYEEIAKAGGGIASTVKRTAAASDEELLDQCRRRLHALMKGGCTTIEIKSGYGLDPDERASPPAHRQRARRRRGRAHRPDPARAPRASRPTSATAARIMSARSSTS